MFDLPFSFDFDRPAWLLVSLVLVPLTWYSFSRLAGLGVARRAAALALRALVVLLVVLAAAEMQSVRTNDCLTVIYLLDQSLSIPEASRERMVNYVNTAVQRQRHGEDRAGVIVFGKEALLEAPPFSDNLPLRGGVESRLDERFANATDLAAAIKLAQATFSEDSAGRIVVVSDGNQNHGDALEQARAAAAAGIGIDVVPVTYDKSGDVIVESVNVPVDVRLHEPFYLRVVLHNTNPAEAGDESVVRGTLILRQKVGKVETAVGDPMSVALAPGRRVLRIGPITVPHTDFYTFVAEFRPDEASRAFDAIAENNQVTAYSQVRGTGNVLVIESAERAGEFGVLVDRLRSLKNPPGSPNAGQGKFEVTVMTTAADQLFTSLDELQRYDAILLANVPREAFSDQQIAILVENTHGMGCGLVMLGGPESFGAGGWTRTRLEEAMPVEFQIQDAKAAPRGALVLFMHASEMADGNHWQKVIAKEAIKALGEQDYAGLIHFGDRGDDWLWRSRGRGLITVEGNRSYMLGLVDRMTPGDTPEFDPGLRMAYSEFTRVDAAVRHMIVISDGDPSPPDPQALTDLANLGVTISAVAVACHGFVETRTMQKLAQDTGGKYYAVTDPEALPKIYQREVRRVARPLVHENENGFLVDHLDHEILAGIGDERLPRLTGLVTTTPKQAATVSIPVTAAEPQPGTPVLATWNYGVGKAVAFTPDAGMRWARDWPGWSQYDKFFDQLVTWSLRPSQPSLGRFTIETDLEDGVARVYVTAHDQNDEFLNYVDLTATVVTPDVAGGGMQLPLAQSAPGRYVGAFPADQVGTYMVTVTSADPPARIVAGVNVPYSAEYRDRRANLPLLESLAALVPEGGAPGKVIGSADAAGLDELLATDAFRHDLARASSRQDLWPALLLAAACLFFADVLVRRVAIPVDRWVAFYVRALAALFRRQAAVPRSEYLERLRGQKVEVARQIEKRKAAATFELPPGEAAREAQLPRESAVAVADEPPAPAPAAAREDTYLERLRKAKEEARKTQKPR